MSQETRKRCETTENWFTEEQFEPKPLPSESKDDNEYHVVGKQLDSITQDGIKNTKPVYNARNNILHEGPSLKRSSHLMMPRLENLVNDLADMTYRSDGGTEGRMLYVERAWSTEFVHKTHAEARAADMGLARFKHFEVEPAPAKVFNLAALIQIQSIDIVERVAVWGAEAPVYWLRQEEEPSPDDFAGHPNLGEGASKAFDKDEVEKIWLARKKVSAKKFDLTTFELLEPKNGKSELACLAQEAGFDFVHFYTENETERIHASVFQGEFLRFYDSATGGSRDPESLLARSGWKGLLKDRENYLEPRVGHPILIFPPDELLATGIQCLPINPAADTPLGDLLLQTAWSRGLSPRPSFASDEDRRRGRVLLRMIKSPLGLDFHSLTGPVTIESLQIAIRQFDGEESIFSDGSTGSPLGRRVHDLLKALTKAPPEELSEEPSKAQTESKESPPYADITASAHPAVASLFVTIDGSEVKKRRLTLTEIMDLIAFEVDGFWEWFSDKHIRLYPDPRKDRHLRR
ncbi:hypothetical protein ACFL2Q_10225 [Thermodesulfobacteriota bacterium]